jgi:integrase
MPRGPKPTVRYWKSRGAYACWIGQTRHFLARGPDDAPGGPTYLEALDKFRKLVSQDDAKGTDDYLVSALMNQYRAHLKATRKSGAPGVFEVMARGFTAKFGKLRVRDLKPYDVDAWLASQTQWNPTSQAHAITLILAAVAWARKKGFIVTDPLAGRVERPQPILRGREARMAAELIDLMIAESRANKMRSQEFADLLRVLRETGARPIELRRAEAFNYESGKLIYRWNATRGYVHKTAKKTQRDRVIFLTPWAQEYVEKLVAANPTGPIFRTPRGQPWSPTSLHNKWGWILKRAAVVKWLEENGIGRRAIRIYNLRHTWACNYLDTTGDVFGCAMMMGTSVKMLQQRYFHMDMDKLLERYRSFMAGK